MRRAERERRAPAGPPDSDRHRLVPLPSPVRGVRMVGIGVKAVVLTTALVLALPAGASAASAFRLSSPAFRPGAAIPKRFSCDGANVSPPLRWTAPPRRTRSLALAFEDTSSRRRACRSRAGTTSAAPATAARAHRAERSTATSSDSTRSEGRSSSPLGRPRASSPGRCVRETSSARPASWGRTGDRPEPRKRRFLMWFRATARAGPEPATSPGGLVARSTSLRRVPS